MNVTIKLFASLRLGRFDAATRPMGEGSRVRDALRLAGVAEADAAIIFVNGKHCGPDLALSDGDSLAVFPPVGGG